MKKWIKLILIGICICIILFVIKYMIIDKDTFYKQFKHINYTDTCNQPKNDYIVYFYMKDCSDCEEIKDKFKLYKSTYPNIPIYLVDMSKKSNLKGWYNWKEHKQKYKKEIGKIDTSGIIIYNTGESANKYLNTTFKNKFGEEKSFRIVKDIQEGNVYVENLTPDINKSISDNSKLKIAETPTVIHVKNKKIFKYYYGPEVGKFFKDSVSNKKEDK